MRNVARLTIVAAAVVVAAVAGYNLSPGQPGPGGPSPTPTPTPTATQINFSSVTEGGTLLTPGTYVITRFPRVRIVFDVPEGWSKGRYDWAIFSETSATSVAFMTVSDLIADPCAPEPTIKATGVSVADLLAGLEGTPGILLGTSTPKILGGLPALRLEIAMPDGWECRTAEPVLFDIPGVEHFAAPRPGETLPVWLVDVDGTRVVISIQANDSPAAKVSEAEAIVEGVRFEYRR